MVNMKSMGFEACIAQADVAHDRIQDQGNLPEINKAAESLFDVIGNTFDEIDAAEFASRFSSDPISVDALSSRLGAESSTRIGLSQKILSAAETEGEAGIKRESLLIALEASAQGLSRVIKEIVEIRADLKMAQREF